MENKNVLVFYWNFFLTIPFENVDLPFSSIRRQDDVLSWTFITRSFDLQLNSMAFNTTNIRRGFIGLAKTLRNKNIVIASNKNYVRNKVSL